MSEGPKQNSNLWRHWSDTGLSLPLLVLIFGIGITIWTTRIVRDQEFETQQRQSGQQAADLLDRTALAYSNSILRIQSYDELFELSGVSNRSRLPTLQKALQKTIFKRLTVFRLKHPGKPIAGELPELQRIQRIEADPTITTVHDGAHQEEPMRSIPIRQGISKILKSGLIHQTVVHSALDGVVTLSVIRRASVGNGIFYIFSTPLTDLFNNVRLSSKDSIVVTDPLTQTSWYLSVGDGHISVSASQPPEHLDHLIHRHESEEDGADSNIKLRLAIISHSQESMMALYRLTFVTGLLMTLLISYLFWTLLSQNRRISRLVVQKTFDLEVANNNLHEALDAKNRFLANVSHEIRTPLNLILGMVDLSDELTVDDRQRSYLNSMKTAGHHLLGMVEDILDLSKPNFQSMDIRQKPINLVQFLEEIGRIIGPLCRENNLQFYLVLDSDLPLYFKSDPSRLRQIVLNLLRNATKYTPTGFIRLQVAKFTDATDGSERIRFEIQDSGVGIPKDRVGQIFDAFFQIESSKILSAGGIGLGLSIVRDLVNKLGGEIQVSSEEGAGSIFSIGLRLDSPTKLPWVQFFKGDFAGPKKVFVLSENSHFQESMAFLSAHPQVELSLITPDRLAQALAQNSDFLASDLILDAAIATDPRLTDQLQGLAAERVLLIGELAQTNMLFAKTTKLIRLEANPFPLMQLMHSLGLEYKVQNRLAETADGARAKAESLQVQKQALSVLIADDDSGNRELFRAYLSSFPWTLRFATNGQEALDQCEAEAPDVLIADLRMPIMDGYTLVQRIRAHTSPRLRALPAILVTADALEETADRIRSLPNTQYLSKPVRKSQMVEAIHLAVGKSAAPPAAVATSK